MSPILQNLKGISVFNKFYFENDPLDEPKKMPPSKNFHLFRKLVKTQNGDQNRDRIYSSLTFQTAKLFPLKRVLKKLSKVDQKENTFV